MLARWQLTVVALCTLLATPLARADTFGTGGNSFEIEFVTIDNPGNPADTTGTPNPAGAVDYVYQIGKYEISRGMISDANAEGGLGITMEDMRDFGGNSSTQPATGVSWLEAATFVNWLNSSSGYPEAYNINGNTFSLWSPGSAGYDPSNKYRSSLAHYFLPSSDEWYKAAYHDPDADPDVNEEQDEYWTYPTRSDTAPDAVTSGTGSRQAVYQQNFQEGPARITQAGGLSHYGVMGLGGNIVEWEETEEDLVNDGSTTRRGMRGGAWNSDVFELSSSERLGAVMMSDDLDRGFRVAGIVAPSLPGDFNGDGVLDADDIDDLTRQSAGGTDPLEYDLTDDALVNNDDVNFWVKDLFGSWIGDANVNGEFNSSDMVLVFATGKYETEEAAVWTDGDWNGDGFFTSGDMVAAFVDGGYEKGQLPAAGAVPEPSGWLLLILGVASLLNRRRR